MSLKPITPVVCPHVWDARWLVIYHISLANLFVNQLIVSVHNKAINWWPSMHWTHLSHYSNAIMRVMASQITCVSIACFTVCSGTDQRKHQRSVTLAFVRGIHRWLVDSPHKKPVTEKMFLFDDVIMSVHFCEECQWCRKTSLEMSPRCQGLFSIHGWTDLSHWENMLHSWHLSLARIWLWDLSPDSI